MMTLERTQFAPHVAWVESLVAASTQLQATAHNFETRDGMLWVLVEGSDFEALAWRAAVGGRLRPSKVVGGVWSKEILGVRCCVRISNSPVRGA